MILVSPLDLRIQHQSNIIMCCFRKLSIVNILPPMSRSSIDTSPLLIRVKRWVWLWVQNSLAECVIYQLKKERRLVVVGGFRWAVDLDILGSILTWSSPRLLDTQFWWVGCVFVKKNTYKKKEWRSYPRLFSIWKKWPYEAFQIRQCFALNLSRHHNMIQLLIFYSKLKAVKNSILSFSGCEIRV